MRHLMQKKVKLVIATSMSLTVSLAEDHIKEIYGITGSLSDDPRYGKELVYLGFLPGAQLGFAAFCSDIHETFTEDYYGNKLTEMEITKDLVDIKSFDLQVWSGCALGHATKPIRYVVAEGVPSVGATSGWAYSPILPFYKSGQLEGLLHSTRGAAEYETLLAWKGIASAQMGAISVVNMGVIALIVMGNIVYFVTRGEKR
jgi:hypothetical protein